MTLVNAAYPVCLNLADKRCVVVGGGKVAERKVFGLLAADAHVSLVAPEATPALQQLADDGRLMYRPGTFRASDLSGAFLVIAATDDPAVNRRVCEVARRRRILVGVVDDAVHSDFTVPAILRQGDLQVAVSTGGKSPAIAQHVRDELAAYLGPEYAALLDLTAGVRDELAAAGLRLTGAEWRGALAGEVRALVQRGELESARKALEARLSVAARNVAPLPAQMRQPEGPRAAPCGSVSLVGAGPGDPGLITARGLDRLREADVVVYDRLVDARLLAEARREAELIYAGKVASRHALRQPEINRLLVHLARQGKQVVRLKGGDPFVFGRGAEEAVAVAREGIPVEVVSGVTSAIAVPASAGIPLTHRDYASSFAVVTGWEDEHKTATKIPWHKLATAVDTLVFLMGVGRLSLIVGELLRHGRTADTPVAVIRWGTWPEQATVTGTLGDIVERVARRDFGPPAVAVVGEVVRLRESIRPSTNLLPST